MPVVQCKLVSSIKWKTFFFSLQSLLVEAPTSLNRKQYTGNLFFFFQWENSSSHYYDLQITALQTHLRKPFFFLFWVLTQAVNFFLFIIIFIGQYGALQTIECFNNTISIKQMKKTTNKRTLPVLLTVIDSYSESWIMVIKD